MAPAQVNILAALDFVKSVIVDHDRELALHELSQDVLGFAGKTFVAGGFVRDKVMGLTSHDIDLVVEKENGGIELAQIIGKRIGREPVVYERFGTAMISLNGVEHNCLPLDGIDIECVHTRKESYCEGSRNPETTFGTLMDDVMRRDLTINSLVMDIMTGAILDLTGRGFIDILNKTIDTTGDSDEIFQEDPLRMLRAVRFLTRFDAQFGRGEGSLRSKSNIDDSIGRNAHLISTLSRERVRDELEKIIDGRCPERGIRLLQQLGLMIHIINPFPNVSLQFGTGISSGRDMEEKFAIAFSRMPSEDLKTFVTSLKFSNNSINKIIRVAHAWNVSRDEDENEWLSSAQILKAAVALTENGFASSVHIMTSGDDLFDYESEFNKHDWLEDHLKEVPKIHFDAAFLMDHFSKKPGKWLGELIELQREAWFKDPWIDKDKAFAIIEESQREACSSCGK